MKYDNKREYIMVNPSRQKQRAAFPTSGGVFHERKTNPKGDIQGRVSDRYFTTLTYPAC